MIKRNFSPKAAVITILAIHGIAGALFGLGVFLKWQALLIAHSVLDKIDGATCRHALNDHVQRVVTTLAAEISILVLLLLLGFVIWNGIKKLYEKIDSWSESRRSP